MTFVLQYMKSRSLDPIKNLKKKRLVEVAVHFGITPDVSATKSHILVLIEDQCIKNNIIDEVKEKPIVETAEVVRLKLEFQQEEWRLEAQRAHEAEKALQDAQFAEAQKDREEAREAR